MDNDNSISHKHLSLIAEDYLRRHGYYVVAREINTGCGEIPDAIGFKYSRSALIECKTSRSDFFADFKKQSRQPGNGVGNYRYYLCKDGLIKKVELPAGWGLIYVMPDGKCRTIKGPASGCFGGSMYHESDLKLERNILLEYIRVVHEDKAIMRKETLNA